MDYSHKGISLSISQLKLLSIVMGALNIETHTPQFSAILHSNLAKWAVKILLYYLWREVQPESDQNMALDGV